MPRRTLWLTTGLVAGAASTLYAERKLRQTLEAASARLQPDALVNEVGRTARQAARSTGGRLRAAVATGRVEMQRREEELWADLSASGSPAASVPVAVVDDRSESAVPEYPDAPDATTVRKVSMHVSRMRRRRRAPKSPSHLGK
jgi:hypothetical protein